MTTSTATAKQQASKSHFRPDIQGLRAVAVLLVLIFHAGDGSVLSGGFTGVDIFFVISGYLITGHLIRSCLEKGKISLINFYAGRIRRILPAATAVLVFTALITILVLPDTRWMLIGAEIIASSVYLVNWLFASNTNYLNAEAAASPVQHYWTLSVEEQFYILWPALLIGLLYFSRHRFTLDSEETSGTKLNKVRWLQRYIALAAVLITLVSLCFSIYFSYTNPAPAYFITSTRLWELGIGAILASFSFQLERISAPIGYALGVMGLASIVAAGVTFDSQTVFPGYAALVPTLGAAAVIIGGMGGRAEKGVGILLKVKPMRWIGDLSYSLYL